MTPQTWIWMVVLYSFLSLSGQAMVTPHSSLSLSGQAIMTHAAASPANPPPASLPGVAWTMMSKILLTPLFPG
jgi:hypothetical protein